MNDDYVFLPDNIGSFSAVFRACVEVPKNDRQWNATHLRRNRFGFLWNICSDIASGDNKLISLESVKKLCTDYLMSSGRFDADEIIKIPNIVDTAIMSPENMRSLYNTFKIPKKSGGFRTIEAPDDTLKKIQRVLLEEWWYGLGGVPKCVQGFVPNRGTKTNAAVHFNPEEARQRVLLKMDLRDFFTSVSFHSLFDSIIGNMCRRLNSYNEECYQRIPGKFYLFCENHAKDYAMKWHHSEPMINHVNNNRYYPLRAYGTRSNSDENFQLMFIMSVAFTYAALRLCCLDERLPQGSPCSPALVNVFMQKFNASIMSAVNRICTQHPEANIEYSIYADDLCVTASKIEYVVMMRRILERSINGYKDISQNMEKTCIFKHGQPQRVTGIEITDKLSISRKSRDKVRAELYNAVAGKTQLSNEDKMRLKGVRAWMRGVDQEGWDSRCEEMYKKVVDI